VADAAVEPGALPVLVNVTHSGRRRTPKSNLRAVNLRAVMRTIASVIWRQQCTASSLIQILGSTNFISVTLHAKHSPPINLTI